MLVCNCIACLRLSNDNGIVLHGDSATDLGVLADDKRLYKGHVNLIVSKVMLLIHSNLCRDNSFLKRVFVTYTFAFALKRT